MNEFLSLIESWSVVNDLTHNSRCQTVNFSLSHEQHINLLFESHKVCTIGDFVIKIVSKVIYIGVNLSSGLSWSSQVLLISKKVFRLLYYTKRLYAFSITRYLRFVSSCILPIIIHYPNYSFPGFWEEILLYCKEAWRQLVRYVETLLKSLWIWLWIEV